MDIQYGEWRKSSYSGPKGNQCIEVAWRKSSYSHANGNACVEVAVRAEAVGLRDSKNPDGPRLSFTAPHWAAFLATLTA